MSPPNSLPPAGIPDRGNTKYALVALLMVLGVGGLFAWRSISKKPAPAPLPSATIGQTASAPTNSKLDEIPLPPPPEEPEEQPQVKAAPRRVGGPPAGCEGKCLGGVTTELEQALQVRGNQARRCYNQALAQDSSLKGHVTIAVRIGPSGNLCSTAVAANDMGSPTVANCAAGIFRAAQSYPSPHGGCAEVNVPLSFVAPGQ